MCCCESLSGLASPGAVAVNFEALSLLGFPYGRRVKEDGWEAGSKGRAVLGAAGLQCEIPSCCGVCRSHRAAPAAMLCIARDEFSSIPI